MAEIGKRIVGQTPDVDHLLIALARVPLPVRWRARPQDHAHPDAGRCVDLSFGRVYPVHTGMMPSDITGSDVSKRIEQPIWRVSGSCGTPVCQRDPGR